MANNSSVYFNKTQKNQQSDLFLQILLPISILNIFINFSLVSAIFFVKKFKSKRVHKLFGVLFTSHMLNGISDIVFATKSREEILSNEKLNDYY